MKNWLIETIILGSITPGLTAFSLGCHLLGAVLLVFLVIAALYIIGKQQKKEHHHG